MHPATLARPPSWGEGSLQSEAPLFVSLGVSETEWEKPCLSKQMTVNGPPCPPLPDFSLKGSAISPRLSSFLPAVSRWL